MSDSWVPYPVLTAISRNKVFEDLKMAVAYEDAAIACERCKAENLRSRNKYGIPPPTICFNH